MVKFAVDFNHPIAIRYPRGQAYDGLKGHRAKISYGKSEVIYEGSQVALLAVGSMVKTAEETSRLLEQHGCRCTLINARFVQPLDTGLLEELPKSHRLLVTMEENVQSGGFGEHVLQYYAKNKKASMEARGGTEGCLPAQGAAGEGREFQVLNISIPDVFVEHGTVDVLKKELNIDSESVAARILESLGHI